LASEAKGRGFESRRARHQTSRQFKAWQSWLVSGASVRQVLRGRTSYAMPALAAVNRKALEKRVRLSGREPGAPNKPRRPRARRRDARHRRRVIEAYDLRKALQCRRSSSRPRMASGIASRFALRVGVRIRARFSSRIFTPLDRVFIPKEQARRGDVARKAGVKVISHLAFSPCRLPATAVA
jgi:hypothetical protein